MSEKPLNNQVAFERLQQIEKDSKLWEETWRGTPLWIYAREPALKNLTGTSVQFQKFHFSLKHIGSRLLQSLRSLQCVFGRHATLHILNERFLTPRADGEYYSMLMTADAASLVILEYPSVFSSRAAKTVYGKRYHPLDMLFLCNTLFVLIGGFLMRGHVRSKFRNLETYFPSDLTAKLHTQMARGWMNLVFAHYCLRLLRVVNPTLHQIVTCLGMFARNVDLPDRLFVKELQHGVITPTHPGYIIPKLPSTASFLENRRLVVYDDKTRQLLIGTGYSPDHVELAPDPRLTAYIAANVDSVEKAVTTLLARTNLEVLLIGQPEKAITQLLSGAAEGIAESGTFEHITLKYLPHPSEKVDRQLGGGRIEMLTNEGQLYHLLLKADVVCGVSSSVLQEAQNFGCYLLVLGGESHSHYDNYVEWLCAGYAPLSRVRPSEMVSWFKQHSGMLQQHKQTKAKALRELLGHSNGTESGQA